MFATCFMGLFVLAFFIYAEFGLMAEEKRVLTQWIYVIIVIAIGLILRILARQIFRTEQIQDFGRAHDVYLYIAQYGPFSPAETWADFHWYQLYYARFPAWFPVFAITRLVYDIFGVGVRYIIALNYVLFAASAALLYAGVRRIFPFAIAFCAVCIFVFNPNLIVWAGITSPDHFFLLLFFAMLYCLARYYNDETRYKFLCLAAAFAALTDFFKPIGLMFLIAFFCVEIFMRFILKVRGTKLRQILAGNYRQWAAFLLVFLAVYFTGHAFVNAGIRRTFHIDTISSTGKFMVFAWITDDYGNLSHDAAFAKFDRLMYEHDNNLPVALEEMTRYAGEIFRDSNIPALLWEKARLTFGDEGVLGWAIHSADAEYSASTFRVLGTLFWIGFTAHIFVLMLAAAAGTLFALREEKNRALFVFLLTTAIGYTLVLLLGIVQARYRLLLYPQFSILAGYGVVGLVEAVSLQKLRKAGQNPASVE